MTINAWFGPRFQDDLSEIAEFLPLPSCPEQPERDSEPGDSRLN